MSEEIVYRFRPVNPGEYLAGVPARDLTAADLAADPGVAARITAPGPSGTAMYRAVNAEPPTTPAKPASVPPKAGGEKE